MVGDPGGLLAPDGDVGLAQELEEREVVRERDRQLHEVVEEVRQDRAAAAGLGVERVRVVERRVVAAPELRHPVRVAVRAGRAEPVRAPLAQAAVDSRQLALEALPALEQPPVVVQAVERRPRSRRRAAGRAAPARRGSRRRRGTRRTPCRAGLELEQRLDARQAAGPLDVVGEDVGEPVASRARTPLERAPRCAPPAARPERSRSASAESGPRSRGGAAGAARAPAHARSAGGAGSAASAGRRASASASSAGASRSAPRGSTPGRGLARSVRAPPREHGRHGQRRIFRSVRHDWPLTYSQSSRSISWMSSSRAAPDLPEPGEPRPHR